jgi:hypothetical protein
MDNSDATLPLMLKQLRLSEVRTHWAALAEKAINEGWSPPQYLAELCHIELLNRDDKRLHGTSKRPPCRQANNWVISTLLP